jgi:hypothetical protein
LRVVDGLDPGTKVAEVLVRRKTDFPPEVRIGIVGVSLNASVTLL